MNARDLKVENERLKAELKARDIEISELRKEIDRLKTRMSTMRDFDIKIYGVTKLEGV
ncbi:MAG: hypothetical protein ACP5NC_08385 [Nitrososphaeria archaeon]